MTVAGNALIGLGVVLFALAAVGVVRLPDVYARLNATTKAASLGVVCVLLGTLLLLPATTIPTTVKLLIAIGLQLVTAPVGAFAIGRASYRAGVPMWSGTRYDELADDRAGRARAAGGDGGGRGAHP